MRPISFLLLTLSTLAYAGVPKHGEALQYNINWPSGLSLGEGRISATKADGENWTFELQFDAAVPAFAVSDKFVSIADANLCSVSLEKELSHGRRKTKERLTFDREKGGVTRETIGGGKSHLPAPPCARDALTFLFHVRNELAAGRIPQPQDVFYGAAYKLKLEYKGAQKIRIGETVENADLVIANVKGPTADMRIEMYFGKDEQRTPLLVKIPIALGVFSVEIVRPQ